MSKRKPVRVVETPTIAERDQRVVCLRVNDFDNGAQRRSTAMNVTDSNHSRHRVGQAFQPE